MQDMADHIVVVLNGYLICASVHKLQKFFGYSVTFNATTDWKELSAGVNFAASVTSSRNKIISVCLGHLGPLSIQVGLCGSGRSYIHGSKNFLEHHTLSPDYITGNIAYCYRCFV